MASIIGLTTFPTSREDTGETSWQQMGRRWFNAGIWQGIRNEFQVYADSSGMRVKVRAGEAWNYGEYCEMTAEQILDIGAANATLSRIDNVVLRLDTTSPATMNLMVVPGTAASSPLAPNVAVSDLLLAVVTVPPAAATIAAGAVADARKIVSTSTRPPITTALLNSWQSRGGAYGPVSFWRDGSGVIRFEGRIYGGTVSQTIFTLPTMFRPQYQQIFMCHAEAGSNRGHFAVVVMPSGDVTIFATTTTPSGIADIDLCSVSFRAAR